MTSKKTIKIAYSGIADSLNIKSKNELILRIIESKSDAVVVIVVLNSELYFDLSQARA